MGISDQLYAKFVEFRDDCVSYQKMVISEIYDEDELSATGISLKTQYEGLLVDFNCRLREFVKDKNVDAEVVRKCKDGKKEFMALYSSLNIRS